MCGISLKAGALTIAPQPGRALGYARAEWHSPVGIIRSAWEYRGGKLRFDFSLPVPATIILPDGRSYEAKKGEHHDEVLL